MNLRIIGTSHIAKQSVEEIKRAFGEYRPDVIAVELDEGRALALYEEKKRERHHFAELRAFGIKGYLFAQLGHHIQQKLGKSVGVLPGTEMKTALDIARSEKIEVALIDQPIRITLQKFSKSFTWRERWHFVQDIFGGIFFPQRQMEKWKMSHFDLRSVPGEEIVIEIIENLKERYPSLYKTLIEDRNRYMVRRLVQLLRKNKEKKILVVVGAGHKKGMEDLLRRVEVV